MAKEGRTAPRVFELCIMRVGAVHAGLLMMDLYWWVRAVDRFGPSASGEELAQVGAVSRSQGFRKLAQLREMFPDGELEAVVSACLGSLAGRLGSAEGDGDAGAALVGAVEVAL